jgi:hypothetical protein
MVYGFAKKSGGIVRIAESRSPSQRWFFCNSCMQCMQDHEYLLSRYNPSQEMGKYVGITMDITDLNNAEKEREKLRQLKADLAHINGVNMMEKVNRPREPKREREAAKFAKTPLACRGVKNASSLDMLQFVELIELVGVHFLTDL